MPPHTKSDRKFMNRVAETPKTGSAFMDEIFLKEYRINGNKAYPAAIKAGFSEYVSTKSSSWIRYTREKSLKPVLWDAFHAGRKKMLTHLDVTYERIMTEYARLAFFNSADWFGEDKQLKHVVDMDEDARAAFGSQVKDKKAALDSLSRVMGMNNDKVKVEMTLADLLDEITEVSSKEPLVLDSNQYEVEDAL